MTAENRAPVSPLPSGQKPRKSILHEWIEAILLALVLAFFIRAFIIQTYKVPTSSMEPTILIDDSLIATKFDYGFLLPFSNTKLLMRSTPKRGDVIVFKYPQNPKIDFIKRVIGVEGDTVEIKDGVLFINGEKQPLTPDGAYDYEERTGEVDKDGKPIKLKPTKYLKFTENLSGVKHTVVFRPEGSMRYFGPVTVSKGHVFAMGDNRDNSNDSRYWGEVPVSMVRGKARIFHFSGNLFKLQIRFERIGKVIR